MKKVCLMFVLMMILGMGTVWASEDAGKASQEQNSKLPRVAFLYVNNAKTDYDAEIDAKILEHMKKVAAGRGTLVAGDAYKDKLASMGIQSVTMAERADILAVAKDSDADALLVVEIEPFTVRDVMTFFTVGKKVTASIPVKAIDRHTGLYLYNGKFVEMGQDNTMIGALGNKSVSMKALDQFFSKFDAVVPEKFANVKRVAANTENK